MVTHQIKFKNRLEVRFLSFFLSLTLLVSIVLFGLYEGWVLQRAHQDFQDHQDATLGYYAEISDAWLWNLDQQHIKKSFGALMEDPNIEGVAVFDAAGRLVAQSGDFSDASDRIVKEEEIYFTTDVSRDYIGKVVMAFTEKEIRRESYRRLLRNGLLVILIGLTAVAGAVYVYRLTVTRPLTRMMNAIEEAGENQWPEPILWKSRDEIGVIIEAFNDMVEKRKRAVAAKDKMAMELQQAQKLEAVGQLAGGIAHEINTPAQYISDNLRFIEEAQDDLFEFVDQMVEMIETKGTDEQKKTLEKALDDVDMEFVREELPAATEQSLSGIHQVAKIVLAMKEFSHPGQKEKSLADLNRTLETVLVVSKNEWKNVAEVDREFQDDLPYVRCLQGEMNQVFLNLVVNAAHAIEEAKKGEMGIMTIQTKQKGEKVEIRVSDNGTGIPVRNRDRIFDPFFTTKRLGQGTGQGLAIAYDTVVNKHGGSLTFETEENKGTTFIVELPV